MKPESRQVLAPTWLIVTHLLGAAALLYFVTYPAPEFMSRSVVVNRAASSVIGEPADNSVFNDTGLDSSIVKSSVINVAELQPLVIPNAPNLDVLDPSLKKVHREQRVAK